jgi:hypothetical protein
MKVVLIVFPLLCIFSCTTSTPESQSDITIQDLLTSKLEEAVPAAAQDPADQDSFDPASVSAEEMADAMSEIQLLIEEINRVIQAKNYKAWTTYLSDDFINTINSPEYLTRISKTSRQLQKQNVVLRTPQDYFSRVVVASRENIRVDAHLDEIEFLSHTRVKAFTIKGNQRLRLFEFVKDKGTWKVTLSS